MRDLSFYGRVAEHNISFLGRYTESTGKQLPGNFTIRSVFKCDIRIFWVSNVASTTSSANTGAFVGADELLSVSFSWPKRAGSTTCRVLVESY
jgi:hypothetical protein